LNENTGYIDASPIYGSSTEDLHKFREGSSGFLKMQNFNGMRLLPFDTSTCRSAGNCKAVFVAGDSRVNLFLGLTSFHILLTKEHNRIAGRLQRLNPHWNGDRIFQVNSKSTHFIVYSFLGVSKNCGRTSPSNRLPRIPAKGFGLCVRINRWSIPRLQSEYR
jgi:hypothetical protein